MKVPSEGCGGPPGCSLFSAEAPAPPCTARRALGGRRWAAPGTRPRQRRQRPPDSESRLWEAGLCLQARDRHLLNTCSKAQGA